MKLHALAASILLLALPATAAAQIVSFSEGSSTLVMPFDLTDGKRSFQMISKVGDPFTLSLRTHWIYYAADCRHLANVDITLTDNDTAIVDATRLQNESQAVGSETNVKEGPIADLTGERGVVFVTAEGAQIAAAWTIADPSTGASFGFDAIGITPSLGADPPFDTNGDVVTQTFNPESLSQSEIIVIGVEDLGDGQYAPIDRQVCCDTRYIDVFEASISAPDLCFACVGHAAISADLASESTPPILPPAFSIATAGLLRFEECRTVNADGSDAVDLGETQGLFVFHGQALGPFGVVMTGRYEQLIN